MGDWLGPYSLTGVVARLEPLGEGRGEATRKETWRP